MKKPLPEIVQRILAAAVLMCFTAFMHPLVAQPGTLDASFNASDLGFGRGDEANGQVITIRTQADGKILVGGGFSVYGGQARSCIARINEDGSLDNTFNPGTGANGIVYDIAIQSDNKILVVGGFTSFNGVARNRIVRLNADGTVDNTFNPGTAANDTLWAVDVQSDGKIIVGGELTAYNGTNTTRVFRLNTNGTLDATFNPGTGPSFDVLTLAVGADNKIVIGGLFTQFNGVSRSGFARLNADGSLDNTFAIGSGSNAAVVACAIQSDGKVLIGGDFTVINGTNNINRLVRLNTDGSRDATFNTGTGFNQLVWDIAVQADGKVLAGGNFNTFNGSPLLFLARLNANGSLDNTFNTGSGANTSVFAVAVKSNGKVLIGGGFTLYNGFSSVAFAQLNSNGTFDTGFNTGTGVNRDVLTSLIQSDGKIYLGGRFGKYFGNHKFGLIRTNTDGSIDNSFNTGTGPNNSVQTMVQQGDGKLIIGGLFTAYNGTTANRLVRINANGSIDASYNTTSGANTGSVSAMVLLPDGKVVIGGTFTQYGGVARGQIARVNIDGTIDAAFNPGSGANDGGVLAIARQADGKLIIGGGFTTYNGTARNRIARINADGSLDNTFTVGSGFADNAVSTISIQADGKIIVGGSFTSFNGTPVGRVVRLNADGSLDATFNTGSGAGENTVFTSMVLNDGRILLGGTFVTFNGSPQGNLVLLASNGSIDPIFQSGTGATGPSASSVRTISMQADGKFIIAGNFTSYNGTGRNRVARINGLPSNPITTGTPPAGPYCPGSSISIPFSVSTTINPGNVFTAQLSNASGSFAAPVNIGTLNGTTSGNIAATIPVPTAAGVGYKIRVVSSNPAFTGTEIGINIQAVQVFFKDADNDGYSDSTTQVACVPPPGYKLQGALAGPQKDCNDNNNTIYPGAPEIENDGIDQDCNGQDKVTTGIRDLKSIQASVFPNPNTGSFNVSILSPESGEYLINIMDISGRLIRSETINIGSGLQVLPLSIDQKGMYIISIQGQSQQATMKVAVH